MPFTILAVLLYLPFYIGFTATPTDPLTEVLFSEALTERHAVATPPFQFLVFWGPLFPPSPICSGARGGCEPGGSDPA